MKLAETLEVWLSFFEDAEPVNSDFFDAVSSKKDNQYFSWSKEKTLLNIAEEIITISQKDVPLSIKLENEKDYEAVYSFLQSYLGIKDYYTNPSNGEIYTGNEYKFYGLRKENLFKEPIEDSIRDWYDREKREWWREEQKAYIYDDFGNTPDDY